MHSSVAGRDDKWQHLYARFTVYLSQSEATSNMFDHLCVVSLRLSLVHGFSEGKEKKIMRKLLFFVCYINKIMWKLERN